MADSAALFTKQKGVATKKFCVIFGCDQEAQLFNCIKDIQGPCYDSSGL